ncbi:MAG: DUF1273 family protein [Clostridia bacterium]|nr:DUF1273 family protein [Clostridia bacterium]
MLRNDLPAFIKNNACCVTGHRILRKDFDRELLKEKLENIVLSGYTYFLIGMARGFDTQCFLALEKIRENNKSVKIYAVIPCLTQDEFFTRKEREEYKRLLSVSDGRVVLYEKYTDNCMLERNDFMLKNSSLLLAYYNGYKRGGTYYTLNKAKRENIEIIYY